jgi:hypothetical protein
MSLNIRQICHQLGIPCTGLISISSHVGEAICQAVDAKKIDVLIMARRGLGKVKRFFVGSTTKYCVEVSINISQSLPKFFKLEIIHKFELTIVNFDIVEICRIVINRVT